MRKAHGTAALQLVCCSGLADGDTAETSPDEVEARFGLPESYRITKYQVCCMFFSLLCVF